MAKRPYAHWPEDLFSKEAEQKGETIFKTGWPDCVSIIVKVVEVKKK
jgi:hypothetical protein